MLHPIKKREAVDAFALLFLERIAVLLHAADDATCQSTDASTNCSTPDVVRQGSANNCAADGTNASALFGCRACRKRKQGDGSNDDFLHFVFLDYVGIIIEYLNYIPVPHEYVNKNISVASKHPE